MPLHDDAKSQLNARYLEGLASIETRKIKDEARGAAVGLCLFGIDVRRQGFWDQWFPELRESLAHLVG